MTRSASNEQSLSANLLQGRIEGERWGWLATPHLEKQNINRNEKAVNIMAEIKANTLERYFVVNSIFVVLPTPRQNVCACVNFGISGLHNFFWYYVYLAANFTKFATNSLVYCYNKNL